MIGDDEELTPNVILLKGLAGKSASKELTPKQGSFDLGVECQVEVDGIGMGVLKDGTAFLTGRGLSRLVGIENLHIRTIGLEWNEAPLKPRTSEIKRLLAKRNIYLPTAFVETTYRNVIVHAYTESVCLAVLEYYAFDAAKPRETARDNYRILAGKALRDLIYSQAGYDPSGVHTTRFDHWHARIALNSQSAPRGFFHVFNEAHTIFYELIMAGAELGEKTIVDISIGYHWSKYWTDEVFELGYGLRQTYPHYYPEGHAQAKANPHEAFCYPLAALGAFRVWLQDIYIESGKFSGYLAGKVKKGDIPLSVAQLAIATLDPLRIAASA